MNYYNSYLTPSCEILVNGQKRKLYGKNKNKIYLNDGDEFQISVYNPLSERIGMQLKMNGIDTDDSVLVINPGQSVIVERFIGTNRKLKFSTYLVDKNNPQTKQAIKQNGILEVKFWNEYKPVWVQQIPITINPVYVPITPIINPPTYPFPGTTPYTPPSWPPYYCGDNLNEKFYCGDNLGSSGLGGGTTTSSNFNFCDQNVTYTANTGNVDINGDLNVRGSLNVSGNIGIGTPNSSAKLNIAETGRIEKGNRSNQHFTHTEFTSGTVIKTYTFKLLPFSEKSEPVVQAPYQQGPFQLQNNPYIIPNSNFNNSYVKSEGREYCPNKRCNYRIRKNNWAYCPICGTQIS